MIHPFFLIALPALMLLPASGCEAQMKMRTAVVLDVEGQPCFTVPETDFPRGKSLQVAMIQIEEEGSNGVASNLWEVGSTAALTLSPDACLKYGSVAGTPAHPLQAGHRYSVFINADVAGGKGYRNRSYMAYFCLRPDPRGVLVKQVEWDKKANAWQWDVCQRDSAP